VEAIVGRYDSSRKPAAYNEKPSIHPIWRGVGFAMMVLIPIISYASSVLLFQENLVKNWFPVPSDLVVKLETLPLQLNRWVTDPYILIKILLAVVIAILIYIVFLTVTYVIYGAFGPKRYGPEDAPPIRRKVRRSR
jgi:hypothetical protein